MKDFAMQLTQKCVSMGLLDESYSEWFAYSIEKRVTTLFTWLVQCLIGGFCFGWTLTISFSVFFLLIRKYTNGYHAATYSKCLFCSILLEVVLLASISYVFRTGLALLFLTIVSDITILYIAPVNNKSIHWSTNEFTITIRIRLDYAWDKSLHVQKMRVPALQTLADASQMFRAVFLTCLFVEAMLGFAV